MEFFDEQRMCHLYEKFLLEYYRKEHPELSANASQIAWQLDDSENQLLPKMQTDIMYLKEQYTYYRCQILFTYDSAAIWDKHFAFQ